VALKAPGVSPVRRWLNIKQNSRQPRAMVVQVTDIVESPDLCGGTFESMGSRPPDMVIGGIEPSPIAGPSDDNCASNKGIKIIWLPHPHEKASNGMIGSGSRENIEGAMVWFTVSHRYSPEYTWGNPRFRCGCISPC
jgi:hypothetical protein